EKVRPLSGAVIRANAETRPPLCQPLRFVAAPQDGAGAVSGRAPTVSAPLRGPATKVARPETAPAFSALLASCHEGLALRHQRSARSERLAPHQARPQQAASGEEEG